MPEKRWKVFERRVARLMGGQRIPVTGERDGVDVDAGMFVVQAKARGSSKPPPDYLLEWLGSIRRAAEKRAGGPLDPPVGIVVWQAGLKSPDGHALVVLRLDDWLELHGPAGVVPPLAAVPPELAPGFDAGDPRNYGVPHPDDEDGPP